MEYQPKTNPAKYFLSYERKAAKMIFDQWKKVAANYPTQGLLALETVFAGREVEDYLLDLYKRIGTATAREVFEGINKAVSKESIIEFAIARVLFYLQQFALTKITSITNTTKEDIRGVLEDMIKRGLSPLDIAKELAKVGRGFSRKQAITIARTESIAAYNFGAIQGAAATGMATHKVWRSARQKRTRPDHIAANNQKVKFDDYFIVGGERLRHPGDPRGSAKQVVNCRCVMKFELKKP
jgi:uncharacterized protein with gpF-like domain